MARYLLVFVLLQSFLYVSPSLGECLPFEVQNGRLEVHHGNLFYRADCDSGYILHGNYSGYCNEWNEWSFPPPICIEIEKSICEELTTPLNGKMECESESLTVGKSCKFTCLKGYVQTGTENRTCLEGPKRSGIPTHWSGTPTHCLPSINIPFQVSNKLLKKLYFPRTVKVLTLDKFDNPCKNLNCTQLCLEVDGDVRCVCEYGYALNIEDGRSCDRFVRCEPFELQNGRVEIEYFYSDLKFYYAVCDSGYILLGSFMEFCSNLDNFQWGHPPPICIEIKSICEELSTPLNGKMDCERELWFQNGYYPVFLPLTVGKSCKFTCLEGYDRTGSENRTCIEGQKWSGTPTQCLQRQKDTLLFGRPDSSLAGKSPHD